MKKNVYHIVNISKKKKKGVPDGKGEKHPAIPGYNQLAIGI